jgi:hypothetical protein
MLSELGHLQPLKPQTFPPTLLTPHAVFSHFEIVNTVDFKLSLCSVLTASTFGCFPGVWFLLADVKPL